MNNTTTTTKKTDRLFCCYYDNTTVVYQWKTNCAPLQKKSHTITSTFIQSMCRTHVSFNMQFSTVVTYDSIWLTCNNFISRSERQVKKKSHLTFLRLLLGFHCACVSVRHLEFHSISNAGFVSRGSQFSSKLVTFFFF